MRPLVAVEQQPFVQAHQQHVARGQVGTEQGFRDDAVPALAHQRRGHVGTAVVQTGQGVVEQVFGFLPRLVGGHDGQLRGLHSQLGCSGLAAGVFGQQAPQRQGLPCHQLDRVLRRFGREGVAQGVQQARLDLREQGEFFGVVFGTVDLAAQGKPFLRPGLQALGRCAKVFVTGVFSLRGFPGVELGFDVAFEDFGQVVVAVKLVFVGNASEGLDGVEDGHVQAPAVGLDTAASTCIQGLGSVVRVSCTHWR